jgi:hypothetical protein
MDRMNRRGASEVVGMGRAEIDNLSIPPLAGVCSYDQALQPGYGVERNVTLLRRYNYVETRLNQISAAWIASTPEWEVKCGFSLHLWLDAEHSAALRGRVTEMREPPLHLDRVPDPALEVLLDEVIRAENTLELLVGVYRVVKPELAGALRTHLNETNPLVDYPTCRVLKSILQEEEDMIVWGEQAISALTRTPEDVDVARLWEAHLAAFLGAAGGIAGDLSVDDARSLPQPRSDGSPYQMDLVPRRDSRFRDSFNMSARIDDYFQDEGRPYDERVYALIHKRLREMDVPEWMGRIVFETAEKPWGYYVDMSRQLWDEARHSMMGEVALYRDGVPFYAYPVDAKMCTVLNTEFTAREAHLMLWAIEQGLMARETGKRLEWVVAKNGDDALLATFQDYDWADEVLHAQIGRRWLSPDFESSKEMHAAAESVQERAIEPLGRVTAQSQQTDWWPEFLEDARGRREALQAHHAGGA